MVIASGIASAHYWNDESLFGDLGKKTQPDGKSGAMAFGALPFDGAAVQFDAAPYNHQTEARSGHLTDIAAAMKRLEKAGLIRRWNAAATIHHAEDGIVIVLGRRQRDRPPFRRIFHRVGQQVGEDMPQQVFVSIGGRKGASGQHLDRATAS